MGGNKGWTLEPLSVGWIGVDKADRRKVASFFWIGNHCEISNNTNLENPYLIWESNNIDLFYEEVSQVSDNWSGMFNKLFIFNTLN